MKAGLSTFIAGAVPTKDPATSLNAKADVMHGGDFTEMLRSAETKRPETRAASRPKSERMEAHTERTPREERSEPLQKPVAKTHKASARRATHSSAAMEHKLAPTE
ncbi:MAG TPA: hypothetical protein VK530_16210, partial [Candidatus Acidoferrum sp.]|nr:hypothetical protein [Candidatus Acidoferrum sp.]